MNRRPFVPEQAESLAHFVTRNTSQTIPVSQTKQVVLEIVSGPDKVCDVWEKEKRVAVGILIDACHNEANAAELSLIVDSGSLAKVSEARLQFVLNWGLDSLRGSSRAVVDLPEWPGIQFPKLWLRQNQFSLRYSMFHMEKETSSEPAATPIPPSWKWRDYEEDFLDSYYEAVKAAFREVPGAFVPEKKVIGVRALSHRPKIRLLCDQKKVIGFLRVPELVDGCGTLSMLGRNPEHRAKGVGALILDEALRLLRDLGAEKFQLEVAAVNARALQLYQRYGFRSVSEMSVYRRILGD